MAAAAASHGGAGAAVDVSGEFPTGADFGDLLLPLLEYQDDALTDVVGDDGLAVVVSAVPCAMSRLRSYLGRSVNLRHWTRGSMRQPLT